MTTYDLIVVRFLKDVLPPYSGLEDRSSSDTFVPVFQAARRHIPEDSNLRNIGICYIMVFFLHLSASSLMVVRSYFIST